MVYMRRFTMKFGDIQDITAHSDKKKTRDNAMAMSYEQYREKLFELHSNEPKVNVFGATFNI